MTNGRTDEKTGTWQGRQEDRREHREKNRRKEREINTKTDIQVVKSIENDQITPALWVWVV